VPQLSVVMPTYQRGEGLMQVLSPLLDDPAVGELVVVVDGSTDDTMLRLTELADRDDRVRPLRQDNAGAGAARQAGVEAALGDVVLLLDDDVLADPGLASKHLAFHTAEPGCVVLGSMPTRPVRGRRTQDVTTVLYEKNYQHSCREYLMHPEQLLDHFWSGNVSMPRELALAVGLGDPELPDLYPMEDLELGLRLKAAGATAVFRPDLSATHLHARPLDRFVVDSERQGAAMQLLHRRYGDLLPAPTGASLAGRLPRPARWLVTGARRSAAAGRLARALCLALVRLLGAVRWWWAQDIALVVLQRVAQAVGARAWERGRA
jgi:glycosyltransferase involved in cell wall biosynthesis